MIDLKSFFEPETVGVFGASPDRISLANKVVENLASDLFNGKAYAFGVTEGEVAGVEVQTDFTKMPKVDLAVILMPAKYIPNIIHGVTTPNTTNVSLIVTPNIASKVMQNIR